MSGQRGSSVVELLVAAAVCMMVCGAILGLLHDALAATPVLEETTDLHQRHRVAADALAADVRAAAAGTPAGWLGPYLAAVEPRGMLDPPGSASDRVLTLRYTTAGGARASLAQPLNPGLTTVALSAAGCPSGTIACGFTAGTRGVLLDAGGFAAFVTIQAIGPGTLVVIDDHPGGRLVPFPSGATIVEATEVTYTFDAAARQLRRAEGGGDFVLADNVIDARFEYFADDATMLPLGILQDGPFQGSGWLTFDRDLARVRTVRASLRFETGEDRMRGLDARLFRRPGTAAGRLFIPDVVSVVDVTLRNGG